MHACADSADCFPPLAASCCPPPVSSASAIIAGFKHPHPLGDRSSLAQHFRIPGTSLAFHGSIIEGRPP